MPLDRPAPITPEARRAAGRVRSFFFLVAAANIVLFAIVLWQRQSATGDLTNGPKAAIAQMDSVCARALAAYNAGDSAGFLACFAAHVPPGTAPASPTEIESRCRRDFGRITAGKLDPAKTTATDAGGTVSYDVTCEKTPFAVLTAKFAREAGVLKLTEWRIEKR